MVGHTGAREPRADALARHTVTRGEPDSRGNVFVGARLDVLTRRQSPLDKRPEAILPGNGTPGFEAVVEEIEPLGYESLVTVRAAGLPITLRVAAGLSLELGRTISCLIAPGGMHWFDPDTGERLPGEG